MGCSIFIIIIFWRGWEKDKVCLLFYQKKFWNVCFGFSLFFSLSQLTYLFFFLGEGGGGGGGGANFLGPHLEKNKENQLHFKHAYSLCFAFVLA
jgi:hypothetical protein